MLTAEAAGLALTIAKGLARLTRRVDLVLAEKVAAQAPLPLPVPDLSLSPTQLEMRTGLRRLLDQPVAVGNDPIATDRTEIEKLLANYPPSAQMYPFVKKYLPELATRGILDLNGSFMRELRQTRPDWTSDPELGVAAFYVSSGTDFRNKSYTWRLALTVVDIMTEFGAENTALFLRDENLQGIVASILERFAEADVQATDSSRNLVRTILKSTLNGALAAKDKLDIDNAWLDSLLDAVVSARARAADPDNFVLGLFLGKGYPLLVGSVLETAADRMTGAEANGFKQAATVFLKDVAVITEERPNIRGFFNDHWGDLLRAGLKSLQKNGPGLLADEDPLLGRILSAMAVHLARCPNSKLLTRETLVAAVDAVAGTVVGNPDLMDDSFRDNWLGTLVESVADTMSDEGIRRSFTREGLEKMIGGVLQTFSDQPQLAIDHPGLAQELLGEVLRSITVVDLLKAEPLASVTVTVALEKISKHPELLKFDYPQMVAGLAGKVAVLVKEKKVTAKQGQDLVEAAVASLGENPPLLLDSQSKLVEAVVEVVVNIAGKSGLMVGTTPADVLIQVLGAVAACGRAALANHPMGRFSDQLAVLLQAGLIRAEAELGNRIGLPSLPKVLGQLVVAWAQGDVGTVDPDNENFKRLFAELAGTGWQK